jgi:hypothetical protein
MMPRRLAATVAFTAALGLGIWGLAFTFTAATFSDGQVLSAAALNALLNDNFQAASDAVAGKVDRSGDAITGVLSVTSATSPGISLFTVDNASGDGYAALFANSVPTTSPIVGIKNSGTGPSLRVVSSASGPLFEGRAALTEPATITVKANGAIENAVGSGLPLAYGNVNGNGSVQSVASTTNFSVSKPATGTYRIRVPGVSMGFASATSVVAARSTVPVFATLNGVSDGPDVVLEVRTFNAAGSLTDSAFSFMVFKPGS